MIWYPKIEVVWQQYYCQQYSKLWRLDGAILIIKVTKNACFVYD